MSQMLVAACGGVLCICIDCGMYRVQFFFCKVQAKKSTTEKITTCPICSPKSEFDPEFLFCLLCQLIFFYLASPRVRSFLGAYLDPDFVVAYFFSAGFFPSSRSGFCYSVDSFFPLIFFPLIPKV